MNSLLQKVIIIFLAITIGTFCKCTVFVFNKASEEYASEYEESGSEKETEVESKGKFEKQDRDGHESDDSGLIQKSFYVARVFSYIPDKNTSPSVGSPTPLYLLYHNWKLDCLQ